MKAFLEKYDIILTETTRSFSTKLGVDIRHKSEAYERKRKKKKKTSFTMKGFPASTEYVDIHNLEELESVIR